MKEENKILHPSDMRHLLCKKRDNSTMLTWIAHNSVIIRGRRKWWVVHRQHQSSGTQWCKQIKNLKRFEKVVRVLKYTHFLQFLSWVCSVWLCIISQISSIHRWDTYHILLTFLGSMASGSWDTARQVIIALNVPNIDDIWVEHSTMDESINLQTYI